MRPMRWWPGLWEEDEDRKGRGRGGFGEKSGRVVLGRGEGLTLGGGMRVSGRRVSRPAAVTIE